MTATKQALSDEANRAINSMYSNAKPTVTRTVLREILLYTDGWMTVRGRIRDIKSKHLGAGVYAIWFAEVDR